MSIRKEQYIIFYSNILIMASFAVLMIFEKNYEFMFYLAVIIGIFFLIYKSNDKIYYPNSVLWGLTIWDFLHLAGGTIRVGDDVLYNLMILKLVGEPYNILKYDQVVHFFGFFVATIVLYRILKTILAKDIKGRIALSIVVVAGGLGFGALNEIFEFIATVIANTNVGGYENTGLDLISDLIGSIAALPYVLKDAKRKDPVKLKKD